jgi:hypothetical protein
MKRSFGPRKTAFNLSESTLERLNMYALAASAAGVGVLTLAQPAEAKIVYTPAHKQIAPNHTIPLDLNHDGKTDFSIHDSFRCTSFCEYIVGALSVIPARQGNEIVGYAGRSRHYAVALAAGVRIGPKSPFSQGNEVMVYGGYDAGTNTVGFCVGPWKNVQNRYLGLKFTSKGLIHYGWARLSATCAKNGENTALMTGYAYETIPGKAIISGKTHGPDTEQPAPASLTRPAEKPASLGALALGAPGLSIWRREKSVFASENNSGPLFSRPMCPIASAQCGRYILGGWS